MTDQNHLGDRDRDPKPQVQKKGNSPIIVVKMSQISPV
ncbi:uncharacterized protein G2W53_024628 [Senna tora]|uniref:Uncharacterized protein n=1 Tax=Senna tora TaxID=362788 RepID=A0A834TBW6_9FABA|nr:uncharacterized protein G2W53_024628 [Senna tora]